VNRILRRKGELPAGPPLLLPAALAAGPQPEVGSS